jgi:hypothetical protein
MRKYEQILRAFPQAPRLSALAWQLHLPLFFMIDSRGSASAALSPRINLSFQAPPTQIFMTLRDELKAENSPLGREEIEVLCPLKGYWTPLFGG